MVTFSEEVIMRKIIKNQKGQSIFEYVVLTSLIGVFCLVGIKTFGKKVETRIKNINQHVQQHMKIH